MTADHIHGRTPIQIVRNAVPSPAEQVDLEPMGAELAAATVALVEAWGAVKSSWIGHYVAEVSSALRKKSRGLFGRLPLPDLGHAKQVVADAAIAYAAVAAARVVHEAQQQGHPNVTPVTPANAELEVEAEIAAALLATSLGVSAGSEATRVHGPHTEDIVVETKVHDFLVGLSDAQPEQTLGGVLHGAGNTARILTLGHDGIAGIYASEFLDRNTCEPCREIDDTFLADAHGGDLSKVFELYPMGGYVDCLGRWRCRGTVIGLWPKEDS